MKKTLWTVSALVLIAVAARAGGQNDAGCGLGSQLFKENKPVDQVLGATTNGTSGNQTFGITTGTLGCTSGGLIKTAKERSVFTATNFRAIDRELAAGGGEYVATLAAMTGCRGGEFANFAKARYEKLVPAVGTTSDQLLNNLDREIASDPAMAKACTL